MTENSKVTVTGQMLDVDSLCTKIRNGEYLSIAGDQSVLSQLPSGNWIAGTIPYFMSEQGGKVSKEELFVHTIEGVSSANPPRLTLYDKDSINRIAKDAPPNGFTLVIMPANSKVHMAYAEHAPDFPNMFFTPIAGWVSGFHLDDAGASAKVVFGPGGAMLLDQQAVAIHVPLPDNQSANISIINLFEEVDGPVIQFSETGFSADQCTIDGQPASFSEFLTANNIDTRLPLVADYSGINVNVSVKATGNNNVSFYAPVFEGVKYQFAKPVGEYVAEFDKQMQTNRSNSIAFSCNCILNFLYSELEGKQTSTMLGPVTFGEIAYQLLNQTLVYIDLVEN